MDQHVPVRRRRAVTDAVINPGTEGLGLGLGLGRGHHRRRAAASCPLRGPGQDPGARAKVGGEIHFCHLVLRCVMGTVIAGGPAGAGGRAASKVLGVDLPQALLPRRVDAVAAVLDRVVQVARRLVGGLAAATQAVGRGIKGSAKEVCRGTISRWLRMLALSRTCMRFFSHC